MHFAGSDSRKLCDEARENNPYGDTQAGKKNPCRRFQPCVYMLQSLLEKPNNRMPK